MSKAAEAYFMDLLGEDAASEPCGIPTEPELPSTVHESTLAALLGVNRSRIAQLVRDGVLTRAGRARFDLHESVRAYTANLRYKSSPMGKGRPSSTNPDLEAEKLRLTRAQADEREAKVAAARGELVSANEVERAWAGVLKDVRASMLAVPSRCGATLPHLSAHDIATLDAEIRHALEGLADGN